MKEVRGLSLFSLRFFSLVPESQLSSSNFFWRAAASRGAGGLLQVLGSPGEAGDEAPLPGCCFQTAQAEVPGSLTPTLAIGAGWPFSVSPAFTALASAQLTFGSAGMLSREDSE